MDTLEVINLFFAKQQPQKSTAASAYYSWWIIHPNISWNQMMFSDEHEKAILELQSKSTQIQNIVVFVSSPDPSILPTDESLTTTQY